jgi:hypothetical protein
MSAVVRLLKPLALPLLLITAGMLGLTLLPALPRASAASFTLFGRISSYSSPAGWGLTATTVTSPGPDLTVLPGETVTINLYSGDGYTHNWGVDYNGNGSPDPGEPLSSDFGSAGTTYTFTATTTPGTYTYWCYIHKGPMFGKFIVQSPPGPDYSVSSNPSSLTIPQGANANSTVSITSLNNFAGSVTLSASPPSSWPAPFFSVNPVTVSAGMTSTSKLTIYVPPGTMPSSYVVPVMASNSSTSRSTNVAVTVPPPSFAVSASPASLTINSASSGMSTITLDGSNGFSGTVSLTTTSPSGSATITLNPASVMLSPTVTSATSALTVSSPLGTFNVTVTATSGATAHSTQVLVNGPDFTITTNSATVSVSQGSSATLNVTLSSENGFSGSVVLRASSSPGGPPLTLNPTSLQVPSSGSVSAILTITTSASGAYSMAVSTGSYTITLNATMGSLSHSKVIPLTVTSPSSTGILTSPLIIGGGIAAGIAVVAAIVYVLRRRTSTKT